MLRIALVILVLIVQVSVALADSAVPIRAFARPATKADALPSYLVSFLHITASRRVASYVSPGRPARRATVYVARSREKGWCIFTVHSGKTGGSCGPSLFRAGHRITAQEGQFFAGVAANDVARLVVIDVQGTRRAVALSRDNGFVYDCRARNGCSCVVGSVEAFGATGKLLDSPSKTQASRAPAG